MQDVDADIGAATNAPKRIGSALSEVVLSGPAVWANHTITTTSPSGVKITFAETNPETDTVAFRTAVYLDFTTVLGFHELLTGLIQENPEISRILKDAQANSDD